LLFVVKGCLCEEVSLLRVFLKQKKEEKFRA